MDCIDVWLNFGVGLWGRFFGVINMKKCENVW